MAKIKNLLYTIFFTFLLFTSCTDKSVIGEWECYDFTIADTTGIASSLIESAVESAKGTILIFHEDSTYQQDYMVEGSEIISERGHYSIHEDKLALIPEKIGTKEISDPTEIEYKSIANSDFLTDIANFANYQYKLEDEELQLIDYIYGQSRNKTNQTILSFKRVQ